MSDAALSDVCSSSSSYCCYCCYCCWCLPILLLATLRLFVYSLFVYLLLMLLFIPNLSKSSQSFGLEGVFQQRDSELPAPKQSMPFPQQNRIPNNFPIQSYEYDLFKSIRSILSNFPSTKQPKFDFYQ